MLTLEQKTALAAFLQCPIELVHLLTHDELYSDILNKMDALGHCVKTMTEPRKPLTRFYVREDNGVMVAAGRAETRFLAAVAAIEQLALKETPCK